MTTLLAMLPLYLFGNLHCVGMCGPLVMMIGRHRYRFLYFLGRLLSFTLAGALAGGLGAVLDLFLRRYQVSALLSIAFGGLFLVVGLTYLFGWRFGWFERKEGLLSRASKRVSLLLLQDQAWAPFLFGFFTVLLPCGQTLIVFSACALTGSVWAGLINGLAFSVLTSPSLFFAMHAHCLFQKVRHQYDRIVGICSLLIATLAFCRGFAELGWIEHLVLHQKWHIILY